MSRPRSARVTVSSIVLAALFAFAGTMHFVIPAAYERIMPPYIPFPREMVLLSGACEIAGGIGLLVPRVRRWAGIGLIALLLAVWPANLQMLLNARAADAPGWWQALLLLRLPLQIVLMWWVWRASHPRDAVEDRAPSPRAAPR
ncbi:MAG TPA: DoxX family protein [Longimicrobium sp.]